MPVTRRRPWSIVALLAPFAVLVGLMALTSEHDLRIAGTDLVVYAGYGERLLSGSIPYRGFSFEYPPLALVPMALPVLASPFGAPSFDTYAWLFTLVEAALAVLVGWLVGTVAERPIAARLSWAILVLAAAPSIAWRYDLWPATLVLVALVATERGRPGLAGVAIGVATLMKIFPIVVLPILAIRAIATDDRAGLARLVVGCAAVLGVIMAPTIALAGPDALQWLTYQLDRGLQIESVGAGLLLLLHAFAGQPLSIEVAFGSLQVVSPGSAAIVAATPLIELVVVGGVWAVAALRFRLEVARGGRVPLESLVGATAAVILAVLVTSKVFSVQYVVWFLPLVPLLSARQRWLGLAIAALSTVVYPLDYVALWQLDPAMTVVLNVRNVLLTILLAWLLVGLRRSRSSAREDRARPAMVPAA
jgi:Glycosyltransferase family 87